MRRIGWALLRGIGLIVALIVIGTALLYVLFTTGVLPYEPLTTLEKGWKWLTNGGLLAAVGKVAGLVVAGWFVMGFLDFLFGTDDYYPY